MKMFMQELFIETVLLDPIRSKSIHIKVLTRNQKICGVKTAKFNTEKKLETKSRENWLPGFKNHVFYKK